MGDDGYIGITNDIQRRKQEWARDGREVREIVRTPDRETARGVEQSSLKKVERRVTKQTLNSIIPLIRGEKTIVPTA
jgi:hypothetical protein